MIIAGEDDAVTPNQAMRLLGVSRAHLYKVDSGALSFTVVGSRDRRIAMADLRDYIAPARWTAAEPAATAAASAASSTSSGSAPTR